MSTFDHRYLNSGLSWNMISDPETGNIPFLGTPVALSVSILDAIPSYYTDENIRLLHEHGLADATATFLSANAVAGLVQGFGQALDSWAMVADITWTAAAAGEIGDVTLGSFDIVRLVNGVETRPDGIAPYPNVQLVPVAYTGGTPIPAELSGDVWIGRFHLVDFPDGTKGGRLHYTLLHELGHALGLAHTGSTGSNLGPFELLSAIPLPPAEANVLFSVMAAPSAGPQPITPMLYDIAAIQRLYGAADQANGGETDGDGNTTWRFGDTLHPFAAAGMGAYNSPGQVLMTLWDPAGEADVIDASEVTTDVTINLNPGEFSAIGTEGALNVGIAFGASIENAIGGEGDDRLVGSDIANTLEGGAGVDALSGGAGEDVLRGGDDDDALVGAADGDSLYGDAGNDVLDGGAGMDALTGGIGDDILIGGDDDDALVGDEGEDELHGQDGHDVLDGGADDDRLFGEDGDDDLRGGGGMDALTGGAGEDILAGGAGDDALVGGDDDDRLFGDDGHDVLDGGGGMDALTGGLGNDILLGGEGLDALVGEEGGDDLHGGDGADVLDGGAGVDYLQGGDGADQLYGGDGADILVGGGGVDFLDGGAGPDFYFLYSDDIDDEIVDSDELQFDFEVSTLDVVRTGDEAFVASWTADEGESGSVTYRADETFTIFLNYEGGYRVTDTYAADAFLENSAWEDADGGFGIEINQRDGSSHQEDHYADGGLFVGDYNAATGESTNVSIDASGRYQRYNGYDDGSYYLLEDRLPDGSWDFETHYGDGSSHFWSYEADEESRKTRDVRPDGTTYTFISRDSGGFWELFLSADGSGAVSAHSIDAAGNVNGQRTLLVNGSSFDAWEHPDGSHGFHEVSVGGIAHESFNPDGSSYTYHAGADGSYSTTFDYGDGRQWEGWGQNDGTHGAVLLNADGSRSETIYNVDGSVHVLGGDLDDLLRAVDGHDNTMVGAQGDDTLIGGDGDDMLLGGPGNDVLRGGLGNDILMGGDGDDTLLGEEGEDELHGEGGHDMLDGGADDDRLFGGEGDDVLLGGGGMDALTGGAGEDTLRGGDDDDALVGDADGDSLYGDDGNDVLDGGAGMDALTGGIGDDILMGGDDDDALVGDEGEDELHGDGGHDVLDGGADDDRLFGGEGDDDLRGGSGMDALTGGAGEDILAGGDDADALVGGDDDDRLFGDDGDDALDGGAGVDALTGGTGNDVLLGGDHNDALVGGADDDELYGEGGDDALDGGEGFDTYFYDFGGGNDVILDIDGAGRIVLNGVELDGGKRRPGETEYTNRTGSVSYAWDGGDLVIDGALTVSGWQQGDLGIQLSELLDSVTAINEQNAGFFSKAAYAAIGTTADFLLPDYLDVVWDDISTTFDPSAYSAAGINQFRVFVNDTDQQVVFAFKGTSSFEEFRSDLTDSGASQYARLHDLAETMYEDLMLEYGGYEFFADGHSLGGGMAQSFALEFDLDGFAQNSLPIAEDTIQSYFADIGAELNSYALTNDFFGTNVSGDPATLFYSTIGGQLYLDADPTTLPSVYGPGVVLGGIISFLGLGFGFPLIAASMWNAHRIDTVNELATRYPVGPDGRLILPPSDAPDIEDEWAEFIADIAGIGEAGVLEYITQTGDLQWVLRKAVDPLDELDLRFFGAPVVNTVELDRTGAQSFSAEWASEQDGSSGAAVFNEDSSFSIRTDDGSGSRRTSHYAEDTFLESENWEEADGSSGFTNYERDGSYTSGYVNADGSAGTEEFSAATGIYESTWQDAEGNYGSFVFNPDGSTYAESFYTDGTISINTTDGQGSYTNSLWEADGSTFEESFDASIGQYRNSYESPDGHHGGEVRNADGSSHSEQFFPDDSYRIFDTHVDGGTTQSWLDNGWLGSDGSHGDRTVQPNGAFVENLHYADGSRSNWVQAANGDYRQKVFDADDELYMEVWRDGMDNPALLVTGRTIYYPDGRVHTDIRDSRQGFLDWTIKDGQTPEEDGSYAAHTISRFGGAGDEAYDAETGGLTTRNWLADGVYSIRREDADGTEHWQFTSVFDSHITAYDYPTDGSQPGYMHDWPAGLQLSAELGVTGLVMRNDGSFEIEKVVDGAVAYSERRFADGAWRMGLTATDGSSQSITHGASPSVSFDVFSDISTDAASGRRMDFRLSPDGTHVSSDEFGLTISEPAGNQMISLSMADGSGGAQLEHNAAPEPGDFLEYFKDVYVDGGYQQFIQSVDGRWRIDQAHVGGPGTLSSIVSPTGERRFLLVSEGGTLVNLVSQAFPGGATLTVGLQASDGGGSHAGTLIESGGPNVVNAIVSGSVVVGTREVAPDQHVPYSVSWAGLDGSAVLASINPDGSGFGQSVSADGSTWNANFFLDGSVIAYWAAADGSFGDESYIASSGIWSSSYQSVDGNFGSASMDAAGNISAERQAADGGYAFYSMDADGLIRVEQHNADGTWTVKTLDAGGSLSSIVGDAEGEIEAQSYDSATGEYLRDYDYSDGRHGTIARGADGSVHSELHSDDGVRSVVDISASGNTHSEYYGADGALELGEDTTTAADGSYVISGTVAGASMTQTYDADGVLVSASWEREDGSFGHATYNPDETVAASEWTRYVEDGTYTVYTQGEDGEAQMDYFAADDTLLGSYWTSADGTYGKESYAEDESSYSVIHTLEEQWQITLEFADGSLSQLIYDGFGNLLSLSGGEGDDVLYAIEGQTNTLVGGAGNDRLIGSSGDDTYVFNPGDGIDRITDGAGGNNIVFGDGITPDMLSLGTGSLLIRVGDEGDAIYLEGFDSSDAEAGADVATFRFADGTELSYAELIAQGFDLLGTSGDDVINGTSVADRIDGGAGDDTLLGGLGGDTYRFGAGSGQDLIREAASATDSDALQVLADPGDVTVTREDDNIVVSLEGGEDRVAIEWFANAGARIESVTFLDDTVWDAAALEAQLEDDPNDLPVVSASDTTLVFGTTVAASSLFSVFDEDGDAPAAYEFWDSTAGNGYFALGGVAAGVNVSIPVSTDDLATATFTASDAIGTDQVWVRVNDGEGWGAWKSWTMYSSPHLTNALPVITAAHGELLLADSVAAASLFSVTDADEDAITQYELWDDVAGGGYFSVAGVAQGTNPIAVTAAQLEDVLYHAGEDPGTEQVWVRASDGIGWGAWKAWNMTSALHVPNAAPAIAAAATQTVLLDQAVAASLLFSATDADDDPIAQYEFWDSTEDNGYFSVDGFEQDVNVAITLAASDLAETEFVGGSSTGSDLVWVRASDGQTWGDWKSWTMNSWPHATNAAPVISAAHASMLTNEVVAASTLFSATDADDDAMVRYELWDDVNGGGYWSVDGVQQGAGQTIAISAEDLAATEYVAGSSPGTEQVWVRAHDGLEWSAWKAWNMTSALHQNNAAPVVSVASSQAILLNDVVDAGALFSVTDADDDSIAGYELWDSTAGNGHWAVDGVAQGVNVGIAVVDLESVEFIGASAVGADLVWARATDGQTWSDWKSWTLQSVPHLTNAAPVVSAANGGMLRGEAVSGAMLFSVSDADDDAITQYQFWDDVNGGGHWRLNGVQQAAAQNVNVAAADLANFDYVGGANAGTERVWVRANDGLAWGAWQSWLMSTEGGMLRGGLGPDTLTGEAGPTVLEGGGGDDTLTDTDGNNVFSGGDGADGMTGGDGNDLFAGGAGDDTIETGAGANVIAHNAGGGWDTVYAASGATNTLSLGGGVGYDNLSLSKSGNDLVVNTGEGEGMVLKDWYAGKDTVHDLQLILDATDDFDAGSSDPLYNRKVQRFDFLGLVSEFDQALAQSPGLTSWALTNALLQFHLSGADDSALGGDLAYWHGRNGSLAGIGLQAAQQVIGAAGFGAEAQTLRPFTGLQDGFVKLT